MDGVCRCLAAGPRLGRFRGERGLGGGITSIYGLAPHLGATSVALLPEATAQLTSPTPSSPRRQAARSEGHAPTRRRQLALAACI